MHRGPLPSKRPFTSEFSSSRKDKIEPVSPRSTVRRDGPIIAQGRRASGDVKTRRHEARRRAEGRKEVRMNATLRRRLERAVRVRDFIRAHRTDGAGEATALTRLEELVQRADVLAAQQRAGVVATRAATMQREELRHVLQSKPPI